jgi:hypothetical protein
LRHSFAQHQRPNLSGTWKLNLGSSKVAPQHKREGDAYKINHAEPRLKVEHLFEGRSEAYSYIVDGKERVANKSALDGETRAKAYWEGETLVIEKHQDAAPGVTTWVSRYSLSQDMQTLRIAQRVTRSSFTPPFDELLVYDRQP